MRASQAPGAKRTAWTDSVLKDATRRKFDIVMAWAIDGLVAR